MDIGGEYRGIIYRGIAGKGNAIYYTIHSTLYTVPSTQYPLHRRGAVQRGVLRRVFYKRTCMGGSIEHLFYDGLNIIGVSCENFIL